MTNAPIETTETAEHHPTEAPHTVTAGAIVGMVLGFPLIAVGIWGALSESNRTKPIELATWVIGADLVHDLLLVPIVLAISWLIGTWAPESIRPPVRWAAATSGVLCLLAWPFVRGYGRNASVPSLLDRNYAQGLVSYLVAVWVAAGIWAAVRIRHPRPTETDQSQH